MRGHRNGVLSSAEVLLMFQGVFLLTMKTEGLNMAQAVMVDEGKCVFFLKEDVPNSSFQGVSLFPKLDIV